MISPIYISVVIPFHLSAFPFHFPHSSIRIRLRTAVPLLPSMPSMAAAQFSAAVVVLLSRYVLFLALYMFCSFVFFLLVGHEEALGALFFLLSTVNVHTQK